MKLNNFDLWLKCAEWGSFIHNGDPGACMYGFNETSSFQSEAHAKDVYNYVKDDCMWHAETDDDRQDLRDIMETAEAYLESIALLRAIMETT